MTVVKTRPLSFKALLAGAADRARALIGRPRTHFEASSLDPDFKRAFSLWLSQIESGALAPRAPALTAEGLLGGLDGMIPPLQFWILRAGRDEAAIDLFLAALPRLGRLGLPIDHFEATPARGRREPHFSRRPISHLAMGVDRSPLFHLSVLGRLLELGADPNSRDAFGVPLLALCSLDGDPERAIASWRLLTESGADPLLPIATEPLLNGPRVGHSGNFVGQMYELAERPELFNPRAVARARAQRGVPELFESVLALEAKAELDADLGPAPQSRQPSRRRRL